jgi:hypothetical protein
VRLLLALLAALACSSGFAQEDIEAIDRTTGIASLRLSFNIAGEPSWQGPAVPHSGHGIEIGLSGGSGEDTQSFSGAPVVFGGRIFLPGTLQHEFDFGFLEVAYRYRRFFGESKVFGIEAIGGLGIASLISPRLPAPRARRTGSRTGAWSAASASSGSSCPPPACSRASPCSARASARASPAPRAWTSTWRTRWRATSRCARVWSRGASCRSARARTMTKTRSTHASAPASPACRWAWT